MLTKFDGPRFFSFGDIATSKFGKISISDHGLSIVIKKFNQLE